jgi:hypothetical protein
MGAAQEPLLSQPVEPTWEAEPYVGVARHSPVGALSETSDRNHLFLGVHITGTVAHWGALTVSYAPEVVPLLLLSNNPTYHASTVEPGNQLATVIDGYGYVAGFAASPIGFETRVRLGARWRLYAATAAGFVKFTRNTPEPDARAFNYTFEFGGGAEYQAHAGWWLRVGYKFHHLSNGYSAILNPAVDGHVVMVGVAHAIGSR